MTITTLKLEQSTKKELDRFKTDRESYDSAIKRIVAKLKHTTLKEELIEGYKNQGKDDLKILEEWEATSNEVTYD